MYQPTLDPKVPLRRRWGIADLLVPLAVISLIFAIVRTAATFSGSYQEKFVIDLSITALPDYILQTLVRMLLAYCLALGFTLVYSYTAYRSPTIGMLLVPLLDILQSIPVLSFLPGVVLALVAIFPGQRIGVELASILLIFTGMTWNMTFSFYQSLVSIPKELLEASQVYRLNAWQRFLTLELPSGAVGLIWNSVMSVAGGWFFLMECESFTLSTRDFTLPGIGSYLKAAADRGDGGAIGWGILALIAIIVLIDFFIWQPLISWSEKFKVEAVESSDAPDSPVLDFLRRSPTIRILSDRLLLPLSETLTQGWSLSPVVQERERSPSRSQRWLNLGFLGGFSLLVLWGTWEALLLLRQVNLADWQEVLQAAFFTALRVAIALIFALVIMVPVGVSMGRDRRLARILRPVTQIAASVPATAIFPAMMLFLVHLAGGLEIGAIVLMTLGGMWYIFFNVVAGAQAIPSELFEAAKVYKLSLLERWRTLILPGIFPYLITGIITAVGGFWNASISAEYLKLQGHVLTAKGLGATITQATDKGNYPLLLFSTIVMSLIVIATNRLIWRPLYRLAQEKYQLLMN